MRWPRFRPTLRRMIVLVGLSAVLVAAGVRWFRGAQHGFNVVVGRAVPRGATLADLEAVAGPASRPAPDDRIALALRRMKQRNPIGDPDGWEEGDVLVYYEFPGHSRWWFQVRGGRLVNYDPAVLLSQPQDSISLR